MFAGTPFGEAGTLNAIPAERVGRNTRLRRYAPYEPIAVTMAFTIGFK
jgi:hypothetical protein